MITAKTRSTDEGNAVNHPLGVLVERKDQPSSAWIKLIDLAVLVTMLLFMLTSAKIFYFHAIFILLTIGAFYWQFNAFVWRASIAVVVITAAMLVFVFSKAIPVAELVEIPMLTMILILVFGIAWQRAKAEDALRQVNNDLEKRVFARTADLSNEIAERHKTEQTLRESEERYRQLIQLSFEAIAIHTEDKIIYLNPAGLKLLGIPQEDTLLNKSFLDFVHPDCLPAIRNKWQQIRQEARGAPLGEEKFLRLDGDQVDIELITIPILYHGQAAMQTVMRDITHRKQAEQARLTERMSIARDLHDSLGQSLGYLHLKLDEIVNNKQLQITSTLVQELTRLRDVANDAYEQVRGLLASLLSVNTIKLTLALRAKAKVVSRQAHFQIQVINRGQEEDLQPMLQQQILSVVSEALTNIVKHANAHHVKLELWWTPETLTITIKDDGYGFDPNAPCSTHSYGLRIMQERSVQMGGLLTIQSQSGSGTQLTLQIPLHSTQGIQ